MLKTNATTHTRVHAFMHDSMKGCAFLRRFMHASVHAWHKNNAYSDSKHSLT